MIKRSPSSPQNPSRLWLWGIHACKAALQNPERKCFRLLTTPATSQDFEVDSERKSLKWEILEKRELSHRLPESAVHQGVALEVAPLEEASLNPVYQCEQGVIVILDQLTDPHNVGAILRTARALNALGVVITDRHSPPLDGVLAKAASGALDCLPLWKATNLARFLDDLKDNGFWTVGLSERGEKPLSKQDYPSKVALVLGAEGEGMRRLTEDKCDFLVRLPTDPLFPTLNVSIAFALALYELST